MVCVETVENWTNLAVIICQLLSADDAMEIGLHKLLDDWMAGSKASWA